MIFHTIDVISFLLSSSTVFFKIAFNNSGYFVNLCIGLTRRSLSFSRLHSGRPSHHYEEKMTQYKPSVADTKQPHIKQFFRYQRTSELAQLSCLQLTSTYNLNNSSSDCFCLKYFVQWDSSIQYFR